MLCGSLDGRGVWGRMDTCISMAESLHCPPEIVTTLFSGYTPIKNKNLKKKKKTGVEVRNHCLQTIYKHVSTVDPGSETLLEEWCRVTVLPSQDWSGQRGPQHPTMLLRLVPSWANATEPRSLKEKNQIKVMLDLPETFSWAQDGPVPKVTS